MRTICPCRFCGIAVEASSVAPPWHASCARRYDDRKRVEARVLIGFMGLNGLALVAILSKLAGWW